MLQKRAGNLTTFFLAVKRYDAMKIVERCSTLFGDGILNIEFQ